MAVAMRLGVPDRVPVMCQLSLGHAFLNCPGERPSEIWFTSEGFARALAHLRERYRFDGILVNLPGRPPGLLGDRVERIVPVPGGEAILWRDGERTVVPGDDNPRHEGVGGAPLARADFDALDPRDLGGIELPGGYTWNIYHVPRLDGVDRPGPLAEVPSDFLRTLDLVRQMAGEDVSLHGEVFSPFTHFMELFGYDAALMALVDDGAKADAFLDRLVPAAIAWGVAQARRGVDAVLISSAFAGSGFLSREQYRRFVLPHERRLVEAIREAVDVPVYTHTCGRIGDRLDLLAETGTMGVDTLDPPPLGDVDLATAKRQIGGRLFIKGNLDSVALLHEGDRAAIREEVEGRLRVGAPGGGYILSTACSVAPRVEPWKLEMLTPLAERRFSGAGSAV